MCFKDNSRRVLESGHLEKLDAVAAEKWIRGVLCGSSPGAAPGAARSHARDWGPRCRA